METTFGQGRTADQRPEGLVQGFARRRVGWWPLALLAALFAARVAAQLVQFVVEVELLPARLVAGLTWADGHRFVDAPLPTVFHLVLAGFVVLLAIGGQPLACRPDAEALRVGKAAS